MNYKNLKDLRVKTGLSQIEFANLLGVSQQTVSAWEVGRNPINKILENHIIITVREYNEKILKKKNSNS